MDNTNGGALPSYCSLQLELLCALILGKLRRTDGYDYDFELGWLWADTTCIGRYSLFLVESGDPLRVIRESLWLYSPGPLVMDW